MTTAAIYARLSKNPDGSKDSTDRQLDQAQARIAELRDAPSRRRARYPHGLGEREVEVLRLVAAGKSNRQIADELTIALGTTQRHVSNILNKTGLSNRTEAATWAERNGLVT